MKRHWWKKFVVGILLVSSGLFFSSCSKEKKVFVVGRDTRWFPQQFGIYAANINIFLNALVSEINTKERIELHIVNQDWSHLIEHLDAQKTSGAFTAMSPTIETLAHYNFSEPFLLTGPVLIVKEHINISGLQDLKGKMVGVYKFDSSALVAQDIPDVVMHTYSHIPVALEGLCSGSYDAILAPVLEASTFIDTTYKGRLKIVGTPLNNEGLRLIVLKGKNESLLNSFNSGLHRLRRNGKYALLQEQYRLTEKSK